MATRPAMTSSALLVAREALKLGQDAFHPFAHRFSPQKFTQPQHFAILVLRQLLKQDFRTLAQTLRENSDLRAALELSRVPHFTTLEKAEKRLLKNRPLTPSWPNSLLPLEPMA